MKAVLIVHNMAIDEEVNSALSALGIDCYTKFTKVLGKGKVSGPHLNTAVWPGANNATLVIVEQEKAAEIMQKIREMAAQSYGREGLKAFMWQIEDTA